MERKKANEKRKNAHHVYSRSPYDMRNFGGVVSAADYNLDTIYVEGERDRDEAGTLPGGFLKETSATGLLGEKNVMENPFTVTTVGQKAIKHFTSPFNGISDALAFDPSVRVDRGGTYTDISIRGMYQSGHNYYVNGIPGLLGQEKIPFNWVDSVSITSGPNLGANGTPLKEAAGGIVNLQSKRADGRPNTDLLLSYNGGSSFSESVDVGRRFGDDNRYGIRVNAENLQGETTIKNDKVTQRDLFVNLDQHTSSSNTNLLIGYNYVDHHGGPGNFSFGDKVTELPSVPDASKLYKPGWAYNEYENYIVALNHEQKLSEHVSAYINAGYHKEDWYGYLDGVPQITSNQGDFVIKLTNYPLAFTRKYLGVGIKGDFTVGSVKNSYLIGVDKNWMTNAGGTNPAFNNGIGSWSDNGNLYRDNYWPGIAIPHYKAPHTADQQIAGWHIVDTMKMLNDKLQVTFGIHGHKSKVYNVGKDVQKSDAVSPMYAVSYQINPDFTIYAGHSESFDKGTYVSNGSGFKYTNEGDILAPTKTKQNEIGVKLKSGSFLNTFTYFHIKQANVVNRLLDKATPEGYNATKVIDGDQTNKGFEWAFTGRLSNKWDLVGGVMYLDAKDRTGRDVSGIAPWSANIGAMYHVNDAVSILGRMTYLDSTYVGNNKIWLRVPSYTKFDFGVSYKTKIGNTPVTFDAMCYNVFGRDYWSARANNDYISLGAPRTFVLSANFQL